MYQISHTKHQFYKLFTATCFGSNCESWGLVRIDAIFVYIWRHSCHVTVTSFPTAFPTLSTKYNLRVDARRLLASGGTVHVGFVENKVAMRHTMIPSIFRTFTCRATLKRRTNGWSRRFGNRRHHNRKVMPFSRVRKTSKSDSEFRHVYTFAWNNSVPTGRIVMKYYIWLFVPKSVEKIQVSLQSDENTWIHEDQYTFSIISRSLFLSMINISDEHCRETGNTHFMLWLFWKIVPFIK